MASRSVRVGESVQTLKVYDRDLISFLETLIAKMRPDSDEVLIASMVRLLATEIREKDNTFVRREHDAWVFHPQDFSSFVDRFIDEHESSTSDTSASDTSASDTEANDSDSKIEDWEQVASDDDGDDDDDEDFPYFSDEDEDDHLHCRLRFDSLEGGYVMDGCYDCVCDFVRRFNEDDSDDE